MERVFKKSSFSGGNDGGDCVEVAKDPDGWVRVRDSKDPTGYTFLFSPGEWDAFKKGVVAGEF